MKPELKKKLETVPAKTAIGFQIKQAIIDNTIDEYLEELKQQYYDNPELMEKILGFNLLEYL